MKWSFAWCFLFFLTQVTAQNKTNSTNNIQLSIDTNVVLSGNYSKVTVIQKMPDALAGKKDSLTLKGNNRIGYDLYESKVDRMTILIPDAENKTTLGYPLQKNNLAKNQFLQEIIKQKGLKLPNTSQFKNYKDSSAKSNWYNQFKNLPTR